MLLPLYSAKPRRQFNRAYLLLTGCLLALCSTSLTATELPAPTGPVLLTITGNIQHTNSDAGAQFDIAMLENLPATSISTTTPWTKGVREFTGVRINTLLKHVGAGSDKFLALAMDNYEIEVSDLDFERSPIIIAYRQNGKTMSVRELGPLWIMLPFDDEPALATELNRAYSVWQLFKMVIR